MTIPGPAGAAATLTQAFAYLQAGQYDKALRVARDILAAEPTHPSAHLLAGEALRHLARADEAGRHLREALALAPEWATAHIALAAFHRERRENARAERHALKAIELDPLESAAWCELGVVYHEQSDQANALRCATQALQIDPGSPPALNLLGMIRLAGPSTRLDAADVFRQALAMDPEDPYSHNNLGVASMAKGDYVGAEAQFRQALAGQPTHPLFRRNLYAALRHQSRAYRLLTLPCQLSLWLSGTQGGFLGIGIGAGASVFILNRLKDPYGPFESLRLGLLGLIVWLVFVWWPLLKLYESLTLRDVQSLARELPTRADRTGLGSWPLGARLSIFVLALLGGAAAAEVAIFYPLGENFFVAFLIMAAISIGVSLLIAKLLETILWRVRAYRLRARQAGR